LKLWRLLGVCGSSFFSGYGLELTHPIKID
jgi:hypothetical protein